MYITDMYKILSVKAVFSFQEDDGGFRGEVGVRLGDVVGGGFHFTTSHNITVEGLTVLNCGSNSGPLDDETGVFNFSTVQSLLFHKNSIQQMTGYGLLLYNCDNAIVTNCSYYHSAFFGGSLFECGDSGGVGIVYNTQYSNTGYTLELSHSNITKCCNNGLRGGSLYLGIYKEIGQAKVLFNHLKLSHNKGGIFANLLGNGKVTLDISNCVLFNGSIGALWFYTSISQTLAITIENTKFVDNKANDGGGGISAQLQGNGKA